MRPLPQARKISTTKRSAERRVPGWLLAALLATSCAFIPPVAGSPRSVADDRELERIVAAHCHEVWLNGIFNPQTLGQSPELAAAVESKLCRSDLTHVGLAAGFGAGTRVFDRWIRNDPFLSFQQYSWVRDVPPDVVAELRHREAAMERWKSEHCGPEREKPPARPDKPLGLDGLFEWVSGYWSAERALVAPELRRRWESCQTELLRSTNKSHLRCRVLEIPPRDAALRKDESASVYFTAVHYRRANLEDANLLPIPYFPPRLRSDLEVSGADCGIFGWKKGGKMTRQSTLRCERRDRSAVRFTIETSKGSCTAGLPAR